jgi:hypothetical protein
MFLECLVVQLPGLMLHAVPQQEMFSTRKAKTAVNVSQGRLLVWVQPIGSPIFDFKHLISEAKNLIILYLSIGFVAAAYCSLSK